jgi:nucleoside-diphosphate-sugar epimerase
VTRTVALTGGTGFIGRHIIECARSKGYHIRALTRQPQPPAAGITWIEGGLRDSSALDELLQDVDVLIHLAGAVRGVTREDFYATNVDGVKSLLSALNLQKRRIPLLYVSSLAARHPELSNYANSKHAAEQLIRAQASNLWTIMRPPAVYGPGDTELQPLFDLMRHGLGVHPKHDGRFSMLFVSDLAEAIVDWVNAPCTGSTLDLHDGQRMGYSWQEILDVAGSVLNRKVRSIAIAKPVLQFVGLWNTLIGRWFGAPMITAGKVRELYYHDWTCSNQEISKRLQWQPQVTFADGFERLCRAV